MSLTKEQNLAVELAANETARELGQPSRDVTTAEWAFAFTQRLLDALLESGQKPIGYAFLGNYGIALVHEGNKDDEGVFQVYAHSPDSAALIRQQAEVIVGMGERISQLESTVVQAAEVESKSAARIKELEAELTEANAHLQLDRDYLAYVCDADILKENESLKEKLRVARNALEHFIGSSSEHISFVGDFVISTCSSRTVIVEALATIGENDG